MKTVAEFVRDCAPRQTAITPSETPCPKCGSSDIHRKYHAPGETLQGEVYGKAPFPREYLSGLGTWEWTVEREFIAHHCRCCQHDWVGKPLAKPKQSSKGKKEQP